MAFPFRDATPVPVLPRQAEQQKWVTAQSVQKADVKEKYMPVFICSPSTFDYTIQTQRLSAFLYNNKFRRTNLHMGRHPTINSMQQICYTMIPID